MNLLIESNRIIEGCLRRFRYFTYKLMVQELGRGSQICRGVRLINPQDIRIGKGVVLNERVLIQSCEGAKVHIGDGVVLSYDVMVVTGGMDISSGKVNNRHISHSVTIEQDAWIGARSVVLPGVTIGVGAVVAAGSIVTCNVEGGWIVGGVPARPIKLLNKSI